MLETLKPALKLTTYVGLRFLLINPSCLFLNLVIKLTAEINQMKPGFKVVWWRLLDVAGIGAWLHPVVLFESSFHIASRIIIFPGFLRSNLVLIFLKKSTSKHNTNTQPGPMIFSDLMQLRAMSLIKWNGFITNIKSPSWMKKFTKSFLGFPSHLIDYKFRTVRLLCELN